MPLNRVSLVVQLACGYLVCGLEGFSAAPTEVGRLEATKRHIFDAASSLLRILHVVECKELKCAWHCSRNGTRQRTKAVISATSTCLNGVDCEHDSGSRGLEKLSSRARGPPDAHLKTLSESGLGKSWATSETRCMSLQGTSCPFSVSALRQYPKRAKMVLNREHSFMPPKAASVPESKAGVQATVQKAGDAGHTIQQLIREVFADVKDIENYYDIKFSATRINRLGEYLAQRVNELVVTSRGQWDDYDYEARVDWHLLWKWVRRNVEDLRSELTKLDALPPLLGWTGSLVELCEKRQKVVRVSGKEAAQILSDSHKAAVSLQDSVVCGKLTSKVSSFQAYQAVQAIEELHARLEEWYGFYADYDPLMTWWIKQPWAELQDSFQPLVSAIRKHLVGIGDDDTDAIVGQPSGRESILGDLDREFIAYSPEEIIAIGKKEYAWCEQEMIKASQQLGYGKDWRKALEHCKNLYVEPGEQTYMVHELAEEAVAYVTERDMVTIPEVCNETWRTFMMSPEKQKINPFFLGGPYIQVSYPTSEMAHEDKLMIMRGNSRPLSRSTVFHELLPGHHLQFYYMDRFNTHRNNFMTPFWTEGWAFYWEMILWDRGFPDTPENRIGMLFWRMHRCTRIVFSLKFHLGEWTPQQCIDYLVDKGGHERATAEGEVRRSFNGDYSPLYQAGYMLGALQFYALRKELVETGVMGEKEYHDRILRLNQMPVELVRTMLKEEKLEWDHKASWKFYKGSHKD